MVLGSRSIGVQGSLALLSIILSNMVTVVTWYAMQSQQTLYYIIDSVLSPFQYYFSSYETANQ